MRHRERTCPCGTGDPTALTFIKGGNVNELDNPIFPKIINSDESAVRYACNKSPDSKSYMNICRSEVEITTVDSEGTSMSTAWALARLIVRVLCAVMMP